MPRARCAPFTTAGRIDLANPFFQSLGTNGRACVSCHRPSDAWTVTPEHLQARFAASRGTDPIFRPNDGADCPSADVSTLAARRQAYSLLLTKGLIRIQLAVPPEAEFQVIAIDDPYDCPETTAQQLALYRRPLPATNLPFLTTVMWDGRESILPQSLNEDLAQQAAHATTDHAQPTSPPTPAQLQQIVGFETALYTAQARDNEAGSLVAQGAQGGPINLSRVPFFVGINAVEDSGFNPQAMTLFDAWARLPLAQETGESREAIARGQTLFNSFPILLSDVAGVNDALGNPLMGTCTTCHDTPNVGNHSVDRALNIGVTDYPPFSALDVSGLPVYTLRCRPGATPPLGHNATIRTTDPGRALITGKCEDIGNTKVPILRGLAARAPYFHNGSAATLMDVVEFYNQRFGMGLSEEQKQDLVAFLQAL